MPATGSLIEVRDVTVRFGDKVALDHVSMSVAPREIVTLVGLNGAGKSTLVRTALGLVDPDSGSVTRAPGLTIGFVPQSLSVDRTMPLTVERFLQLGGRATHADVIQILSEVGADYTLRRQVVDLSGGEFHRVLLARALLRRPDLLVLDEPMSGVDVSGQADLYRLIGTIRDRYGCGILLVSHDLFVVMGATDRVICLNGHVCCSGQPHSVVNDDRFIALFGRRFADAFAAYDHHHDHAHHADGTVVSIETGGGAGCQQGTG